MKWKIHGRFTKLKTLLTLHPEKGPTILTQKSAQTLYQGAYQYMQRLLFRNRISGHRYCAVTTKCTPIQGCSCVKGYRLKCDDVSFEC